MKNLYIIMLILNFKTGFAQLPNEGLILNSGPNKDLLLQTNNTTKLEIGSNGNIGIGRHWADAKLHVVNGNSTAIANNASIGIFESNNNGFLSILTPGDKYTGLLFGSPKYKGGAINYNHALEEMTLRTNGTDKVKINVDGNLGIGNLFPQAKLDINGDIIFSKNALIAAKTGIFNDFDRNGSSIIQILNPTGSAVSLGGISDGKEGMLLYLYVGANSDLTILHNSAGSVNKIVSNTLNDILIDNGGGATLMFVLGSWRVISIAQ